MKIIFTLIVACLLVGCAKTKEPVFGETFPMPPKKKGATQPPKKNSEKTEKKPSPEKKATAVTKKPATANTSPVVTPSTERFGRIALVNTSARFVILSFPVGEVAEPEKRMNVYRDGLKVGELRVTGPQRDNNTVADIVIGEPHVEDEVREN